MSDWMTPQRSCDVRRMFEACIVVVVVDKTNAFWHNYPALSLLYNVNASDSVIQSPIRTRQINVLISITNSIAFGAWRINNKWPARNTHSVLCACVLFIISHHGSHHISWILYYYFFDNTVLCCSAALFHRQCCRNKNDKSDAQHNNKKQKRKRRMI